MRFLGFIKRLCLCCLWWEHLYEDIAFLSFMTFLCWCSLWVEHLCEVYRVYKLSAFMRYRGLLRECLYEVPDVYKEICFMKFMGLMRRTPALGQHLYEVCGVYKGGWLQEESAFVRIMGFLRTAPLWGLCGFWERTSLRRMFYEVYRAYLKMHSPHTPHNPNKAPQGTLLKGPLLIRPTNITKAVSLWRLSSHEGHKPLKDGLLINPLIAINR